MKEEEESKKEERKRNRKAKRYGLTHTHPVHTWPAPGHGEEQRTGKERGGEERGEKPTTP